METLLTHFLAELVCKRPAILNEIGSNKEARKIQDEKRRLQGVFDDRHNDEIGSMQLDAEETIKVSKFLATEVETLTLGKLIGICCINKAVLIAQRDLDLFDRGKTDFEYITDLRNSMIHYGECNFANFPPKLEKYEREELTKDMAPFLPITYSNLFIQRT